MLIKKGVLTTIALAFVLLTLGCGEEDNTISVLSSEPNEEPAPLLKLPVDDDGTGGGPSVKVVEGFVYRKIWTGPPPRWYWSMVWPNALVTKSHYVRIFRPNGTIAETKEFTLSPTGTQYSFRIERAEQGNENFYGFKIRAYARIVGAPGLLDGIYEGEATIYGTRVDIYTTQSGISQPPNPFE